MCFVNYSHLSLNKLNRETKNARGFSGLMGTKQKSVKTSEIEKTTKRKLENVIKRLVDMQKSVSDLRKELKKTSISHEHYGASATRIISRKNVNLRKDKSLRTVILE